MLSHPGWYEPNVRRLNDSAEITFISLASLLQSILHVPSPSRYTHRLNQAILDDWPALGNPIFPSYLGTSVYEDQNYPRSVYALEIRRGQSRGSLPSFVSLGRLSSVRLLIYLSGSIGIRSISPGLSHFLYEYRVFSASSISPHRAARADCSCLRPSKTILCQIHSWRIKQVAHGR